MHSKIGTISFGLVSSEMQHLLDNPACATKYNPKMFTILETSDNELHLSVLKALNIIKYHPSLCKWKQFYKLFLFNINDFTTTKLESFREKLLQVIWLTIFFFTFIF